jgi:GNAT superfamily N-acetyltransferase
MEIRYKISGKEFNDMRVGVGWKETNTEQLDKAIENSMAVIGIYEGDELVAMGRLVGDYYFKALLSDIIVKKEYQKRGYGRIVVTRLVEIAKDNMKEGDLLCIEGAPTYGNREFYVKCGFKYKPEIQDGIYLWIRK